MTRIVLFPIFACSVSGEFHLCPHVNLHSRQADEYDCCFLGLLPYIAVVTNVDWEHVDIFPDEEAVKAIFRRFLKQIRVGGHLILCGDRGNAVQVHAHCWMTQKNQL